MPLLTIGGAARKYPVNMRVGEGVQSSCSEAAAVNTKVCKLVPASGRCQGGTRVTVKREFLTFRPRGQGGKGVRHDCIAITDVFIHSCPFAAKVACKREAALCSVGADRGSNS